MRIILNGSGLELESTAATIGAALAAVDDLAERSGEIVVGVRLDGSELDAAGIEREAARPVDSAEELAVTSVPSHELRGRACSSAVEALDLALARARGQSAEPSPAELAETWSGWRSAFEGLLSADEASFADYVGRELDAWKGGDGLDAAALAERLAPIRSVFAERRDEVSEPERAMADAAAIFASRRGELSEVPVLLQTGKDAQAMRSLVLCVELVNKATRIIPELARRGFEPDAFLVEGKPLPAFYGELNGALRELMGAFEAKDAVSIGDVALYELEPRLGALFSAFSERFGGAAGGAAR